MTQLRSAVVTGAASGIGRALASVLSGRDIRLVLADVDEPGLTRVADELGAEMAVTDVSDPSSMQDLAAHAGACDLVCLNAGTVNTDASGVWESTPEEWRRVFDVNLGGVVNGLRSFVPPMLEHERPGSLLITASLAGLLTWPVGGPYAASKHAVLAVAEQAALSLHGTQLSVTVLCPSLVRTAMSTEGRDPVDVAEEALDAVAARRFAVVPHEWKAGVVERARRLAAGHQPLLPEPTGVPGDRAAW